MTRSGSASSEELLSYRHQRYVNSFTVEHTIFGGRLPLSRDVAGTSLDSVRMQAPSLLVSLL